MASWERKATSIRIAMLCACVAASAPSAAFSPSDARQVVDQSIELIAKNYVFPEARVDIVARLMRSAATGRYDVDTQGMLVERLSPDLNAAGNDRHVWIRYDPAQNAALRAPQKASRADGYFAQQGRLHNQGYEELRVLPGNVRYVNLTQFYWNGAATASAIRDCVRFLGGGDAAIIDLRGNGGGSGEAVQGLVSYFLPPDHRKLMTFHEGAQGAGSSTYVLGKLPTPRLVGKPLYVLTSNMTGSAAEEFAYHVANFKLGTLVGRTTAGAANNNTLYPVGHDFVMSVSTGRPEHPVTHSNWQGTGVIPAVDVPSEKALDQAHLLALQSLAARPGTDAERYGWAIAGLEGRMTRPAVDARALVAYVGTYGNRVISLRDGVLVFQRGESPPTSLRAIGANLFEFGNTEHVRLRFRQSADQVVGIDLLTDDGQIVAVDRTP